MPWVVRFDDAFEPEFDQLTPGVQAELLARARVLEQFGPQLGRPHVDTLTGSKYPNMKELRFHCDDGLWRVAFALEVKRDGILLAAGNKAGVNEELLYELLIWIGDRRCVGNLEAVKDARGEGSPEIAK